MNYYIYYLICPISNKVRYVGKSKNPKARYKQHINKLDKLKTQKREWLEMLISKNLYPLIEIKETCTKNNGIKREQYHIDLNKDTIYNIHNPTKGKKSFNNYPKIINENKTRCQAEIKT